MSRISRFAMVSATVLAAGAACWLQASEPRRWPKPTPPPPPSPIYQDVDEPMPTPEEIARVAEQHTARLQREIEQALAGQDRDRVEAVFVFLLPELLQMEPQRVVGMVAALAPGRARDRLRDAVARQWVVMDPRAATEWIKTLEGDDRRASARQALTTLRPIDPARATVLVKELALERLEESLERVTAR
jgi:hypothetical protein